MTDLEKEQIFRKEVDRGNVRAGRYIHLGKSAEQAGIVNEAAYLLGDGIEIFLKNNIIFDDFRKSERFTKETDTDITINGKTVTYYAMGSNNWANDIQNEDLLKFLKENN